MFPGQQGIDLSGLRDIHLPPPPSLWPLAWGWWALAGMIAFLVFAFVLIRRQRRASAKRYALEQLNRLAKNYAADPYKLASEISLLLRRVALLRFPKDAVAGLYGKQWRDFLAKTSKKPVFDGRTGNIIETVMYVPADRFKERDLSDLVKAAGAWINEHA